MPNLTRRTTLFLGALLAVGLALAACSDTAAATAPKNQLTISEAMTTTAKFTPEGLPPIDAEVPATLQTATFALG